MRNTVVLALCLASAACQSPTTSEGSATSAATAPVTATTPPPPPAAAAPKPQKLDPLPLVIDLPETAVVEKSAGTGVFVSEGSSKLLIAPLTTSFDQARKAACDPLICNLEGWVKEEKDLAVAKWGGMLPGFRAFRAIEVGKKKYLCQNVGDSAPSAEAAEAIVKRCSDVKPAS